MKGSADHVHPKTLNDILNKVEGTEIEHVVNSVMLRSMKKAFYGTQCLGHFGLGVSYYCHFTSPIRRYPDLIIHRIIKESIQGTLGKDRIKQYRLAVEEAADQSSIMERKAEELEREVEKLKKAEYMSYHVNEEFDGIISGVNNFGFFVEIPNTIEGLVRVDTLKDDYYAYEAERYRLVGQNSHKSYSLGDKVLVRLDSVDVRKREINFVIAGRS
jgi:ribonuclease R